MELELPAQQRGSGAKVAESKTLRGFRAESATIVADLENRGMCCLPNGQCDSAGSCVTPYVGERLPNKLHDVGIYAVKRSHGVGLEVHGNRDPGRALEFHRQLF